MSKSTLSTLRWGLLGLALIVLARPGSAVRAAELRWKFHPGEALHYALEQTTVTTVKLENVEIKTTLIQTTDMTWHIKSIDEKGSASVAQRFNRVRTKIDLEQKPKLGPAPEKFDYDSQNPAEPSGPIAAGLLPLLKALAGSEFLFKINAQGEVSDVVVPADLLKKLREAGAGAEGGAASPFSEEGLKNMIAESSLYLPAKDMAKGDSWTRPSKVPAPPIGTMVLDKTFRYDGAGTAGGKEVEKITLETKVTVEPAPDNKVPFKIKSQEGKGSFSFDNDGGHVTDSNVSEKIETVVTDPQRREIDRIDDRTAAMKLVSVEAAK